MGRLIGRVFKVLVFLLVMTVLAVSIIAAWTVSRFRASTPEIEGQLTITGLGGPVVIARDENGVPHIFGASEADVFFGLGYAHAQDRMFQMELIRRSVEGRLAEIVPAFIGGDALVRADARTRTLGHHRTAQAMADNLSGPALASAQAYAAGVNAVIGARGYAPPPEFVLLGARPEPWDVADTAAVWVYMTNDLVTGVAPEYQRLLLAEQLTPEQIDAFVGDYPPFGDVSLALSDVLRENPSLARAGPDAHLEEDADDGALAPPPPPSIGVETEPRPGSNSWVVDGEHTRSGLPMLANDPHLGLAAPGVWYLARLSLPQGEVVGGTLPGTPLVILGRNERIAWGFTNTGYDVSDYVTRARTNGAAAGDAVREETIKVRLGKDVTLQVTETDEGALLDPAYFNVAPFGEDVDVILRTTADDTDSEAPRVGYDLMSAQNWDEFVAAGRGFRAPMQNMVYADVEGNIGYMAPGRLPIRGAGGAWSDEIPYEDLPRVLNPASGVIATANNKIAPDGYPYPIDGEFEAYRIMRILDRLTGTDVHDLDSFRAIQLDVVSELALRLLPSLPRARPETDEGAAVQFMLADWDGALEPGSAEALAFAAWFEALHQAIYADELGELFPRFNGARRPFIDRVLSGEWSQWCDDVSTTDRDETCAAAMGVALDAAAARLIDLYGDDPSAWRWGDAHQVIFAHPLMSSLPLLDRMFTVRAPHGGDGSTVNVGHFIFGGEDFHTFHGAGLRAIYDLADLDGSLFIATPGQSGHPFSPHYRDLAPMWSNGDYIRIDTEWDLRAPPPGMRILELLPED